MAQTLMDALFPAACCGCGKLFRIPRRPLPDHEKHTDGTPLCDPIHDALCGYLCDRCVSRYAVVVSPFCLRCGVPFESPLAIDHVCGDCRVRAPSYAMARAAGVYEEVLKNTIHQYKYGGRESLARPLGRLLWNVFSEHWHPDRIDRVVPVPLHRGRLRQRGFNQAYALVREWPQLAARDGWHLPADWLAPDLLERRRPTRPQAGLSKDQRIANLADAFGMADTQRVRGQRVLLVDDVMTTGATVDACTRVLLKAGAHEVRVLTVARAVR